MKGMSEPLEYHLLCLKRFIRNLLENGPMSYKF